MDPEGTELRRKHCLKKENVYIKILGLTMLGTLMATTSCGVGARCPA